MSPSDVDSACSPQMCSSLGSTYRALHAVLLAKSRHNDIPNSPVARATLRALIDQTRSDLETCSDSTTHSQILRVLELQESLLAPIRTLPSDILTEIFQLLIETSSKPGVTYSFLESSKLSGRIFLLTWICFRWRREALSYANFWSRIDCHLGNPLLTAEVTAFLTECILRSGASAPLNVRIVLAGLESDVPPSVITMLVAQGHRWRRAALVSVHPGNILFLLKHSATRFPLLEDFSYNSGTNITFLPAPFLEYHPPLQKLELSVLLKSDADAIASQSLKVLKIHRYCGGSLARLLHLCPCLEFLTLQSLDFREGSDDNLITCQSSLLALDIGGDLDNDRKVEHGAWTYVTLPKLTKLDVTLPDLVDIERWPEAAFEAGTSLSELKMVVKRSECPLQRVNLIVYAGYYNMEGKPELEVVEEFLEDFPVKPERCFVQDVPLQEWKAEILATVSDSSA